jgi:hypothetical protein
MGFTMPGDIIEITPEDDPKFRSQGAVFARQHEALLAEHAIQETDQALRRPRGLSVWLALAVFAGAAIATIFIYLFGE